jgi:zinc protease
MRAPTILFSTIFFAGVAFAQAAKQSPPPAGPARPFGFPKIESKTLENGLTVFVIEDHRQPLVSCRVMVPAGAIAQDPQKAGLSEMTAELLRNGGTKTRTSQQIAKLVDDAGGNLGANAGEDNAAAFGTFLKSTSDLGFELVSDIVLNPVFDDKELDRLRRQALSGLQIGLNDPQFLLSWLSPRVVYGRHPYAYPNDGTPETLRALKREDIVTFHREHYVPSGSFLAVAGDITPPDAFAKAQKYFGGWTGSAPSPRGIVPPPAPQAKIVVLDKPDAVQSRIYVGHIGIARNSPDYIPLTVANYIYGGAFTSRLNMKLRANEGLTYGASSHLQTFRQTGAFVTDTFTRTEKTVEAVKMIETLQKDFATNPVTESELADAKSYLAGVFALAIETPDAVADRVLQAASNGLPSNYWETYTEKIRSTTPEQVVAAVKKYYQPDKMAIAIVGNASQFSKDLAASGPVTTIKLADFDVMAPDLMRVKEAVPAATAESLAKGKALIEAAAQAMGGVDALKAVKDMTSKSALKMKTPQGEMSVEAAEEILYPDKYHATMTFPFGQMQQVFDGKSAWMKQGQMVRELPAQLAPEVRSMITGAGSVGFLRAALQGHAEVQALDDKTVLWKQGESTAHLEFDPESHRVVKMRYRAMGLNGPAEIETAMSDYKDAGGIQLPWKESMSQGGQVVGERVYSERKVNVNVPADAFVKPQ